MVGYVKFCLLTPPPPPPSLFTHIHTLPNNPPLPPPQKKKKKWVHRSPGTRVILFLFFDIDLLICNDTYYMLLPGGGGGGGVHNLPKKWMGKNCWKDTIFCFRLFQLYFEPYALPFLHRGLQKGAQTHSWVTSCPVPLNLTNKVSPIFYSNLITSFCNIREHSGTREFNIVVQPVRYNC